MGAFEVMASQSLHSVIGNGTVGAIRTGVTGLLHSHAGKRRQIERGERFENLCKIRVEEPRISYMGYQLKANRTLITGNSSRRSRRNCSSHRKKESQACRCMSSDTVNGEETSFCRRGEQFRAGGEMTSECLYVKRTICDGEMVEHTGSVIILGDVKHGGYVSAGGDVIVLGRLQGTVQAGRAGNHSAKVFTAFQDSGTIRIGAEAMLQLTRKESYFPCMAELGPEPGRILIRPAVGEAYQEWNNGARTGNSLTERSHEAVDSATQNHATQSRRPAQVALFTGVYISVAGMMLFTFPKLFGILFDLKGVSFGWVQVGAVLAVVFGVYYIGTAVGDMRGIRGAQAFYYSTVVGRIFLFFSFTWLVLAGAVPSALLLVGTINLVGAGLMWRALMEKRKQIHRN